MKIKCYRCKLFKEISEFYVNKAHNRGYSGWCKSCWKEYRNRPEVKERMRKYFNKHWKKYWLRVKGTENYKKRIAKYNKKYRKKYKHKFRARWKLRYAVKIGKIKKGKCEVCKSNKVEAHHDDYSKPYEVKWFCRKHHVEYEKSH